MITKTNSRKFCGLLAAMLLFTALRTAGQTVDKLAAHVFFAEEKPLEMTISTDFKTLMAKRKDREYQPATVAVRLPDSTEIKEDIRLQTRGHFRLENCVMPPLYLNFKDKTKCPKLHELGKLKLVCGCAMGATDEQLIIKEYLAYKIYNMLTPKSFRVRLVKVTYDDTRGKMKKYDQYGFLLEDADDMAERNACKEIETGSFSSEMTNRKQMTLVTFFEYMIGNLDWSVPNYHNIKIIRSLTDSINAPFVVPYDLNHTGIVNASYAAPPENMGIESVTQRVYRGYPRTMDELEETAAIYKAHQEEIMNLVKNCEWLSSKCKKEVGNYLEEFYRAIDSPKLLKRNFLDNAVN